MPQITVEKVLNELRPVFFKYKIQDNRIQSCGIETSSNGKEVNIKIYRINQFSNEIIAYLMTCFDLFIASVSDKWEQFTFSITSDVQIAEGETFYRYTFQSKNNTNEDLAGINFSHLVFLD